MDISPSLLSAAVDDKPKRRPLGEDELKRFGNWIPSGDVKEMARDLQRRGLIGAEQIAGDNPDTSTAAGITNSQGDWKPAAISALLVRARQAGLNTPEAVTANKDYLMGGLDPRIKDALNNPTFSQIHPNFWQTFNGILRDQYSNESAAELATKGVMNKGVAMN